MEGPLLLLAHAQTLSVANASGSFEWEDVTESGNAR